MDQTRRINHDSVVTELMKGLDQRPFGHFTNDKVKWLEELRTIGFRTPRQTGTSLWATKFFLEHQTESLLILRSDIYVKYFRETHNPQDSRVISQGYVKFMSGEVSLPKPDHLPPDPEALENSNLIDPLRYVIVDDCHLQYLMRPLYVWLGFKKFREDLTIIVVQ